ncbi:MAG: aldo/keto reductase [Phycisphaerae bacterium]|nr:aldo/keto reductase [Phycisphaerae bacterium]
MEYRKLGKTDIEVSAVTFGAWAIGGWMWGGQDHDEAIAAINAALDAGITSIDTAAVYGFGRSEQLVAEAIAGRREELVLMTKFGLRWDIESSGTPRFETTNDGQPVSVYRHASHDSVILECERSLQRLKTDYIDVFQIHWPAELDPIEETYAACAKLVQQGKIRAVGVCNYTPELMEAANNVVPLASSQPPYSMVLRDAENDVIPWCIDHNVGVVAYSPMQRGLLTGKITDDYKFSDTDHRKDNIFFSPQNVRATNEFLAKIKPIADAHSATLAQLVINWTTRQPGITAALVGARNVTQATENAKALDFTLTDDELKTIESHLAELKIQR